MTDQKKERAYNKKTVRIGRILLILFFILLIGGGTTFFFWARAWLGENIRYETERMVARLLHETVTIHRVTLHILRGELVFHDIRWWTPSPTGELTVFARIERVDVRISLHALLKRTLWIRTITLVSPRIQVEYDARGRANWPKLKMEKGGKAFLKVRLDEIRAENVSFFLTHHGIPLQLGLMNVSARLIPHRQTDHMVGAFRIRQGFLRMYDFNPWEFHGGLQVSLSLDGPRFDQVHLSGEGFDLWGTGRVVGYGSPDIDVSLIARFRGQSIEKIYNVPFRIRGDSSAVAHYDGDFTIFRMFGLMKVDNFRMGRFFARKALTPIYMTHHRLTLWSMTGQAYEGNLTGDFTIDPLFGKSHFRLGLTGEKLSADAFGTGWGLRKIHHSAEWRGTGIVSWEEDRFDRIKGWTAVYADEKPSIYPQPHPQSMSNSPIEKDWAYPVRLQFLGDMFGFEFRHFIAHGRIGDMTGEVEGRVTFDGRLSVQARARTSSIFAADLYYRQWLWNLFPEERDSIELLEMYGEGEFDGVLMNRVQDIAFEGKFIGKHIRYFDVDWGDVVTNMKYWHKIYTFHQAVLTDGAYRAEADIVYLYLGEVDYTIDGDTYAEVRFLGYPVERVLEPTPVRLLRLKGPLRGKVILRGNYQRVDLEGDVNLVNGSFQNFPIDFGVLNFRYENFLLTIREGKASIGESTITFSGHWNRLDGSFENFHFTMKDLKLADIQLFQQLQLKGTVDLSLTLNGLMTEPTLVLHGHFSNLTWKEHMIGDCILRDQENGKALGIWLLQDRGVSGYLKARWPRPDETIEFVWKAERFHLPSLFSGNFSGEGRGTFHFTENQDWQLSIGFQDAWYELEGRKLAFLDGRPIRMSPKGLVVPHQKWGYQNDTVSIEGEVTLKPFTFRTSIKGTLALSFIRSFFPEFKGSGKVVSDLNIYYQQSKPFIQGALKLLGVSLKIPGSRFQVTQARGDVILNGSIIQLRNFEGHIGGDRAQLQGELVFQWSKRKLEFINVQYKTGRIRLPVGQFGSIEVSARGVLSGTEDELQTTGEWLVHSGDLKWNWTPEFYEKLFRTSPQNMRTQLHTVTPGLFLQRNVRLQIQSRVEAPVHLSVSFGAIGFDAFLRWQLRTTGTLQSPGLLGSVSLEGGTLTLLNRRFTLTHGQLLFVNPSSITPILRLEAETQIQSYYIRMILNGPLNQLSVQFVSDPPLPSDVIINMLGGQVYEPGETLTQEATGFFTRLGSTFLFSLLAQPFTKPAQEVFGIDRLTIDVSPFGIESTPTPRLTLGKKIANRWFITYSVWLTALQQQIWLIEYTLSETLRVIVSYDEDALWGVDFFYRR